MSKKVRHSRVACPSAAGSGYLGLSGWIPGLALLARNDGDVILVIPAKAGIQRDSEHLASELRTTVTALLLFSLCLQFCVYE
jgi:hypothetical protein